jgi:hypothetical protein
VRYTLIGDTNLDSIVNVGDLGAVGTNYGLTIGASWSQGDFNYDGSVDVGDLGALATNYGQSLATGPDDGAAATVAAQVAAVPEPVGVSVVALMTLAMPWRRRGRHARKRT